MLVVALVTFQKLNFHQHILQTENHLQSPHNVAVLYGKLEGQLCFTCCGKIVINASPVYRSFCLGSPWLRMSAPPR